MSVQLVVNAFSSFMLFDFFEDGLADLFCLKTYTHGTSPRNYSSILQNGANPALGGQSSGEQAFHKFIGHERTDPNNEMISNREAWDSRGKFFVFKDACRINEAPENLSPFLGNVVKKLMPRVYAAICTIGEMSQPEMPKILTIFQGIFQSFASPTLKFRFLPEDAERTFQDDETFQGGQVAAYTREAISPDHIGLYGTIVQGCKGNLIDRIKKDPWRFLDGLIKVVACVALAVLAVVGMTLCPPLLVIGGVLLAFEISIAVSRVAVPLLTAQTIF